MPDDAALAGCFRGHLALLSILPCLAGSLFHPIASVSPFASAPPTRAAEGLRISVPARRREEVRATAWMAQRKKRAPSRFKRAFEVSRRPKAAP